MDGVVDDKADNSVGQIELISRKGGSKTTLAGRRITTISGSGGGTNLSNTTVRNLKESQDFVDFITWDARPGLTLRSKNSNSDFRN